MPRAEVILLPGREDRDIWAYFASLAFPPERQVRADLAALGEAGRPLSAGALETRVDLSRGRLESMLKVLDVDGAVRRVSGGWTSTGQPWHYDAERYERVAAERAREQQAMLATRRRTAAGWSTCAGSSTTRPPRRAGAATTAPASRPGRRAGNERGRGARAAAAPGRARSSRGGCGRPG